MIAQKPTGLSLEQNWISIAFPFLVLKENFKTFYYSPFLIFGPQGPEHDIPCGVNVCKLESACQNDDANNFQLDSPIF